MKWSSRKRLLQVALLSILIAIFGNGKRKQ